MKGVGISYLTIYLHSRSVKIYSRPHNRRVAKIRDDVHTYMVHQYTEIQEKKIIYFHQNIHRLPKCKD